MTADELETDRETFRARLQSAHMLIEAGDADAANAETDSLKPLTERWDQRGRLADFLTPLTAESEEPYVRFGAASTLLSRGHSELAMPVLDDIRDNTRGTASLSARSLVNYWRRQQAKQSG